jgi:tRNA pseudouridine38-40 synthase
MSTGSRTVKLVLAYDGTNYCGWQRQKRGQQTIQGMIEEKISTMTGGGRVVLHGAGRTDAGVHALAMVAHFRTISTIPCRGLVGGLNSLLPEDIRVLAAADETSDFHARHSAVAKIYWYQFFFGDILPPTVRLYWAQYRGQADYAAMEACLQHLVGEKDFSSFEASGSRDPAALRGAVRIIYYARLHRVDATGMVRMEICGNGFLRHMVRNIAGTVAEVALAKKSVDDFRAIVLAKDRSQAGPTAPARGLFLKEVKYDHP